MRSWARSLGCAPTDLRRATAVVVSASLADDSPLVYAMTFGDAPVARVSATHADALAPILERWTRETLRDPAGACASLGMPNDRVIGPASLAYADDRVASVLGPGARLLTAHDLPAAESLREACTPLEWEHGGTDVVAHAAAGSFDGGRLAALAGFEVWGEAIAHIAVITRPACRGRGHGAAAVSMIARHALDSGLVAQYRTLESNAPSQAIAKALGFVPYATSLAVRRAGVDARPAPSDR